MSIDPIFAAECGELLSKAFEAFTDYQKTKEQEITERKRIRTTLEVATKVIESNRINFEKYMETSFTERERLYKIAEKTLNQATEDRDVEMAKAAMNLIATIYHKNPMEGLEKGQNSIRTDAIHKYLE